MSASGIVFGVGAHHDIADVPAPAAAAGQADRAGLDLISLSDHPYFGARLDAYAAVGFILGRTERLPALVNVTNLPTRPAPMLARTVTSLSALSGGRIVLGMGAGGLWDRIADMGVPRLSPGRRGRGLRGGDRADQEAVRGRPAGHPRGPSTTGSGAGARPGGRRRRCGPGRSAPSPWPPPAGSPTAGSPGTRRTGSRARYRDVAPGHRRGGGRRGPRPGRDPHDLQPPRATSPTGRWPPPAARNGRWLGGSVDLVGSEELTGAVLEHRPPASPSSPPIAADSGRPGRSAVGEGRIAPPSARPSGITVSDLRSGRARAEPHRSSMIIGPCASTGSKETKPSHSVVEGLAARSTGKFGFTFP